MKKNSDCRFSSLPEQCMLFGAFDFCYCNKLPKMKHMTTTECALFIVIGSFITYKPLIGDTVYKLFTNKNKSGCEVCLSNKWLLDRVSIFGITSPQTIYRAVSGLERKGYLHTHIEHDGITGWAHKYYALTMQGISCFLPPSKTLDFLVFFGGKDESSR